MEAENVKILQKKKALLQENAKLIAILKKTTVTIEELQSLSEKEKASKFLSTFQEFM